MVSMMVGMLRSYVVTGAARGVGRAIADRLLRDGDAVVVLELDPAEVGWIPDHPVLRRYPSHQRGEDAADQPEHLP
jgi:NAD(P)-dependent dehydrogenase (short-subunit alcohol dehydrogenase family)